MWMDYRLRCDSAHDIRKINFKWIQLLAATINAKTLWTKYQITLHCCIFDPPCPPFNVEAKNYDTKCCIQNEQHCLGWEEGGSCFI